CSRENMDQIDPPGGRFVTVLPRSRTEDEELRRWIQTTRPRGPLFGMAPTPAVPTDRATAASSIDRHCRRRRVGRCSQRCSGRFSGCMASQRMPFGCHEGQKLTSTSSTGLGEDRSDPRGGASASELHIAEGWYRRTALCYV